MKQVSDRLKEGLNIFSESRKVYKRSQKHPNKQPIGYPATLTGVERRILHVGALSLNVNAQIRERLLQRVRITAEKLEGPE